MKRSLTDRQLRTLLRPHAKPVAIGDSEVRGLEVRASKQGVVSFSVLKRPPDSRKLARYPVGTYPLTSLAAARKKTREILREIENGVDPRARQAEELRVAAAVKASTFGTVAEAFISRHVKGKRTARDIEQLIRREFIPRWSERPIGGVTRADVIAMVDEILDRGHRGAARLAFAYVRRLFGWAVPRYDLQHAPTDHLSAKDLIGAKKPRQRVLSDDELVLIWRAAGGPEAIYFGAFVRLLLLLGVRRSELGRARWLEFDEFEAGRWIIPAQRAKTDEPHVVPLPASAVEILRTLARLLPRGTGYVIGGPSPIHYARAKQRLDACIKALNGGKALPHWTFHDLRRTFRTGLSRLGIAPHVAELCLGHSQPGLHKVYDQHKYAAEQRHAFDAWAAHVMRIVAPPADVVVALHPAR
jgi:integrase